MKKITLTMTLLLFVLFAALGLKTSKQRMLKEPVVINVLMKEKDMSAALQSTQSILLQHQFIPAAGIQARGITATRTTGSLAGYTTATTDFMIGVTFVAPIYHPDPASDFQKAAYTGTGSAKLIGYNQIIDCRLLKLAEKCNEEIYRYKIKPVFII